MASNTTSKCLCCGAIFQPDARNRGRQTYCPQPSCRRAGKAARQRRWREQAQNLEYFRGAWHVERVRAWRAAHPGYWRTHRRQRVVALQDALTLQVIEPVEVGGEVGARALQDALRLQGPVLIGLIAHLTDSALQDDIAATTRGLLELGQDILAGRAGHGAKARAAP